MSRCYVPRSVYFELLVQSLLLAQGDHRRRRLHHQESRNLRLLQSTINNANSRLVPDKLAVFLQYTTNFQDNYYQFKSCTYDQESLTNIPLSVMPGKYKIQCHLVSYKFNNANQTDILDIYQVHGENDMTLIGRAEGIVANAFDNGLATRNDVIGLLSAEYEVTAHTSHSNCGLSFPASSPRARSAGSAWDGSFSPRPIIINPKRGEKCVTPSNTFCYCPYSLPGDEQRRSNTGIGRRPVRSWVSCWMPTPGSRSARRRSAPTNWRVQSSAVRKVFSGPRSSPTGRLSTW